MRLLRLLFLIFVVIQFAQFAGCKRHTATEEDCEAILHRLVDLELSESGYRDPILRTRWQNDLDHRFAGDLGRCRGREVRSSLRPCLATAQSSEEIIHHCLD
jgi:hypothetical protein